MILRMEDLQESCSKILAAVDSSFISPVTETLSICSVNKDLVISVTNREYLVRIRIPVGDCEEFAATVNAKLFLKLIAQTTSETVELTVKDNYLVVNGNGSYKFPLIYEGSELLVLPEININNVTTTMNISTSILHSLITYNSKELLKGIPVSLVQKLYYIDEAGAITFINGACVNDFTLEKPIKVLLNDKLVKLFKLFKDEEVRFSLGYDPISEEQVQTKVRFETDTISISAILTCDDKLLATMPVTSIRSRVTQEYPYRGVLNKDEFNRAIGRLLLFSDSKTKVYNTFDFTNNNVTIWDADHNNSETIMLENEIETLSGTYTCIFDILDLKTTLDTISDSYININFGDNKAAVVELKNIHTIIPEINFG